MQLWRDQHVGFVLIQTCVCASFDQFCSSFDKLCVFIFPALPPSPTPLCSSLSLHLSTTPSSTCHPHVWATSPCLAITNLHHCPQTFIFLIMMMWIPRKHPALGQHWANAIQRQPNIGPMLYIYWIIVCSL